MADNHTFRLALLAALAVFAPFAMYYRARSATSERLDRWQEGVFILFGLRLSALGVFIACVFWMIDPQTMAWSSLELLSWLRWLGVGLVGCTGLLVVWTFRNLGKNLTDTVVTRTEHRL